MKKIVSLVLALCLVLMMGTAFADESTYSGSISVSGLDDGDEVSFYQIVEWVGETTDKSDVTGWKAISPYDTVLTTEVLTQVLLGTKNSEGAYENKTGITPALAGELAKKVTSTSAKVGGSAVTATSNKASVTTTKPGIFMALVKPVKVDTVYNPIFVSVDYKTTTKDQAASAYDDGSSTVKKSTLKIEKTADNSGDYNGDHADTTAVGDTVTFTVKATIPAYGAVYTNPHYEINDKLTALQFQSFTSITANGLTTEDYTAETTNDGYTINFKANYLKKITTATEVTVVYTAKVTTDAAYAINQEDNEVMIKYSHDPSNESDYDVKKDTTQHYTFTLDAAALGTGENVKGKKTSELVKIGVDASGNPITQTEEKSEITETETWKGSLAEAEFGLWKNDKCTGEPIKTAKTGSDGRMTFDGLDAGNYWLKEISAPDGFVASSTIHPVVITAVLEEVTVTEYWNGTAWSKTSSEGAKSATYTTEILKSYSVKVDDSTSTCTFTNDKNTDDNDIQWEVSSPVEKPSIFQNQKGVELPSTGGIGTTIFYILGGLLVVGAAVILVARRKAQD